MVQTMTERQQELIELEDELKRLCGSAEDNYLAIGKVLWEVRTKALYNERGLDFKAWLQDFRLPTTAKDWYNWAVLCSNVYGYLVEKHNKPIEELKQLGRTKMIRLVSTARDEEIIPDDLWQFAIKEDTRDIDIREKLGHNVSSSTTTQKKLSCPNCGGQGLKCIKCGEVVQE